MEIIVGNSYKTKGGFKATITSIDENHPKPYLAWVTHQYGKEISQYHRGLTAVNSEFDIISEWDESELPIYYHREISPEQMGVHFDKSMIDIVRKAVESNSNKWFQDEKGNKYQGSKTWTSIYYKLLEKHNK